MTHSSFMKLEQITYEKEYLSNQMSETHIQKYK